MSVSDNSYENSDNMLIFNESLTVRECLEKENPSKGVIANNYDLF
jgi:hypothetical protein